MAGTTSLPHLQDLIKRDPQSYKDEFLSCYNYMEQLNHSDDLEDYISFIAHVVHLYPTHIGQFVSLVFSQLKEASGSMDPERRMTFCKALINMRHKGIVNALSMLELFFRLFRCPDKKLRTFLVSFIVKEIKTVSKDTKQHTKLQNFVFNALNDSNIIAAKKSLEIMIELYKKNVWHDAKTVNAISQACLRKETKILVTALRFFLGDEEKEKDDDDDEDEDKQSFAEKNDQIRKMFMAHRVGKKSKKRLKRLQRSIENVKRKGKNKKKTKTDTLNFAAIHFIYDPQDFAEKLFKALQTTNERFEIRMLMMDLISRLIGVHKLQLLGYYTFLQQYLKPHQRDVTKLLLFAAQASHTEASPDALEPIVREIADNFVTERVSIEGQAVGVNAIREIVLRCPYAASAAIVADLLSHRSSSRSANVMAAIHSLVGVLRRENPAILQKKHRGKPNEAVPAASIEASERRFGEQLAFSVVPGAEILKTTDELGGEETKAAEWESCSENEDDDSDGEWVDVHHSSDEEEEGEKPQMTSEEAEKRAADILSSRILTQEEFEAIRREQQRRQQTGSRRKSGRKRAMDVADRAAETGDVVSLSAIERLAKKSKSSKEERMETVLAGREGREKYGFKNNRLNAQASTTNREKQKQKPFDMVKHKVRGKAKRSFRDKQTSLRNRLRKVMKKR